MLPRSVLAHVRVIVQVKGMAAINRQILAAALAVVFAAFVAAQAAQLQEPAAKGAVTRRIGAIKTINGSSLILTPDSGSDVAVTVQPNARLLRIAPGEKDLKNAVPIQLQDLQVGDRILVGGKPSEDAESIVASSVVVMKRSEVEALKQQELQDWQKRGLGGLVTAVDASSGTVTISIAGFGGTKNVTIRTAKSTVIRRYAPDSVKFDDAKVSSLTDIHPGDQLRARGNRSADGAELTADEIVTGTFRNLAGVVNSVDASSGTINVQDLLSKTSAQVKVTQDSQLRKLPPEMAQRIAARLKGGAIPIAGASSPAGASTPNGSPQSAPPSGGTEPAPMRMRTGGAPDFQQMLSRMPALALADLHKGDAVLVVATQGETSGAGTAITLLSGVEPILQAAPTAGQAMMLAPWSLGGPSVGDANQ
jgi:hypothetical protein